MNKTLSVSEISEPPLLMLFLAAFSLVFNLCFPQYTAKAHAQGQAFIQDRSLKDNMIALNTLRDSLNSKQYIDNIALEPAILPKVEEVTKVKTTAKPKITAPKNSIRAVMVPSPDTANSSSSRWVTVTAYSSTVDQCDSNPFITASGSHVRDGVIATNLLAFGTKVKFPSLYGDKIFTVEDRMNQRFSNRADIWFETREQAKQFGVKKLEMVIVS